MISGLGAAKQRYLQLKEKVADGGYEHQAFALLLEPCGTRREPQKHLRAGVSPLPPVQTLSVNTHTHTASNTL